MHQESRTRLGGRRFIMGEGSQSQCVFERYGKLFCDERGV